MLSEAMVCFPIVILALLGLTLTSQPTVAVGQTLPTTLLDKFDDASKLASIAYCITGAGIGSKITCDRFCCDFPDMILEEFLDPNQLSGLQGFVARDNNPSNKRIVVSFRGTHIGTDIIQDVLILGTDFGWFGTQLPANSISDLSNCPNCLIHSGFLKAAELGLGQIRQKVIDLYTPDTSYKIEVVGHSSGGAVAEIVGTALTQVALLQNANIEVITLAEPRVGNPAWADFVDSTFSPPNNNMFYRLTHSGDFVVHVPPPILFNSISSLGIYNYYFYEHPETEYWITHDPPVPVTQCVGDDSLTCSFSEELGLDMKVEALFLIEVFAKSLAFAAKNPFQAAILNKVSLILQNFVKVQMQPLVDAHGNYFETKIGDCTGNCTATTTTQQPPPGCTSVPAAYTQASQYCQTLCARVCAVTVCLTDFLQQGLVDSCYEGCACETQGLSLGSTTCVASGTPQPGLVYCYTDPGCPPSNGHYFSQADVTAYDQIFNLPPNTCPLGATTMLTGYS